ncbi:MAG: acyl carrier protein [Bacillota bacterium]
MHQQRTQKMPIQAQATPLDHVTSEVRDRILRLVEAAVMRKVSLDEPLLESGLVDSITAVDLALQVETELGVEIPAEKIHEYLRTVRSLAEYVASHR